MKSWIILLALALVGCAGSPTAVTPSPSSRAAEMDHSAAELLAEKDKCAPALAWLKDTTNHMMWKGDRAAITRHLEEQQKAGAKEIWATGLEDAEGKQICAMFVVVLPEGEARKRVIANHNVFWRSYLSDATAEDLKEFEVQDQGQKYLEYNFDL